MFLAAQNGSAAMIEKLLKGGADVNAPVLSHGETALMMAARSGSVDAVKVLLDHGAQVEREGHPARDHGADVGGRTGPCGGGGVTCPHAGADVARSIGSIAAAQEARAWVCPGQATRAVPTLPSKAA